MQPTENDREAARLAELTEIISKPLPEGIQTAERTLAITLPTLDHLKHFWEENRDVYRFAAWHYCSEEPAYLRPFEWVFSTSEAALIETVTRWDKIGLGMAWLPWDDAGDEEWSDRPLSQQGDWILTGLPLGETLADWIPEVLSRDELHNRELPLSIVRKAMQESVFIAWSLDSVGGVLKRPALFKAADVEDLLKEELEARARAKEHYGSWLLDHGASQKLPEEACRATSVIYHSDLKVFVIVLANGDRKFLPCERIPALETDDETLRASVRLSEDGFCSEVVASLFISREALSSLRAFSRVSEIIKELPIGRSCHDKSCPISGKANSRSRCRRTRKVGFCFTTIFQSRLKGFVR